MVEKCFPKDPDAVLDFGIDWTEWLEDNELITVHAITAEVGITVDSNSETDGVVTIWLSGGTAGTAYNIACKITTDAGRTEERSILIRCEER